MTYILSIYCTFMFPSLLSIIRVLIVTEYSNSTICAFVPDTIIYKCVGLDLDNTFVNNCILDQCTYCWFAVLCNNEHPDDDQQWRKHVGAINWENVYYLCVLLVYFNNATFLNMMWQTTIIYWYLHTFLMIFVTYEYKDCNNCELLVFNSITHIIVNFVFTQACGWLNASRNI